MKKHIFLPVMGILALGATSVLLTGCGKNASEAPATGYAGGQKSGAVSNTTSDPNYTSKSKGGSPTSGGR